MTWAALIRVSGLVALYLLILDVGIGAIAAWGLARQTLPVRKKYGLHSLVAALLGPAVLVHVASIVVARYQGWTYSDIFQVSHGHTAGHNLGVAALYLLAGVYGLLAVRRWTPKRVADRLHRTVPVPALVVSAVHGYLAGTDAKTLPVILPETAALTLLVSVLIVRWTTSRAKAAAAKKRLPERTAMTAPVPATSASSPVHLPAAVAAGSGGLLGLLTIFLPLLQGLPMQLTPGEVKSAVWAGVVMAVGSVGGYLAHHGYLTAAQLAHGEAWVDAHPEIVTAAETISQQIPAVKTATDDAKRVARAVEAKGETLGSQVDAYLKTLDTQVSLKLAEAAPTTPTAEFARIAALEARSELLKLLGGHNIVTTSGTVAIPPARTVPAMDEATEPIVPIPGVTVSAPAPGVA